MISKNLNEAKIAELLSEGIFEVKVIYKYYDLAEQVRIKILLKNWKVVKEGNIDSEEIFKIYKKQ